MKTLKYYLLAMAVMMILGLSNAAATSDPTACRFPQTGTKTRTDRMLTVDYSHADQGYVMVRIQKSEKRTQLHVKHGSETLHYNLSGEEAYTVIPLQLGSGNYEFSLWIARKKGSNQCEPAGTVRVKCTLADETSCFLYPNQYVNYDADCPAIQKARELCKDVSDPTETVKIICGYVQSNFSRDEMKTLMIQSNRTKDVLPDIMATWESKEGVCQDVSALTCAMLRSMGIPAKLAIGTYNGNPHAWVVFIIDGKGWRFDPQAKKGTWQAAGEYHAERFY